MAASIGWLHRCDVASLRRVGRTAICTYLYPGYLFLRRCRPGGLYAPLARPLGVAPGSPATPRTSPRSTAQAATWARDENPSLPRMLLTWMLAAPSAITSASAIWRLVWPRAISSATSRSRGVRGSADSIVVPAVEDSAGASNGSWVNAQVIVSSGDVASPCRHRAVKRSSPSAARAAAT